MSVSIPAPAIIPNKFAISDITKTMTGQWREIEITDIPTATPGIYTHTAEDSISEAARGAAGAEAVALDPIHRMSPTASWAFWLSLGEMTLKKKFGRCLNCAAAALYSLAELCGTTMEIAGVVEFDHHFLIVGRANAASEDVNNRTSWGPDAFIVDIWDTNRRAAKDRNTYAYKLSEYYYGSIKATSTSAAKNSTFKIFCRLDLADRAERLNTLRDYHAGKIEKAPIDMSKFDKFEKKG